MSQPPDPYLTYLNGRRAGLRDARYSWWAHWGEVANFFLPRRYRWLVTANQTDRGRPLNERILDSSACGFALALAAGLMSGKVSPSQPWLKLGIDGDDATGTTPTSLWLADCERRMRRVFSESNFYTSVAAWIVDLVHFGTAPLLIYEDFDTVINCETPCAGEYYVAQDGRGRPTVLFREFTLTVAEMVSRFGVDNVSDSVRTLYRSQSGSSLSQEYIIGHAIEPNNDGRDFGVAARFAFREAYWEIGSANSSQTSAGASGFLRLGGFHEQPHATARWDIVANDAYGRSPGMDNLPDQKQLQLETRRKAQAIDKKVNPPMLADARLRGQPATQLPGGVTYIEGLMTQPNVGFTPAFKADFDIGDVSKDLEEIRERLRKGFYNNLFQPISQFETRSNITAVEINQRKAESLIMLGPVFERLDNEGLRPIVERVWGIMSRAGCFAPAPQEIAGKDIQVKFISMLALAQDAAQAASISQVFGLVGDIIGVHPEVGDKIDFDAAIDIYSKLNNNDPRMMRTDEAVAKIRADRAKQQQDAANAQQAEQLAAYA